MISRMVDSRRTGLFRCAALFVALAVAALVAAPAAQAAEGVTRSLHGVNYTLPADWEEVALPEEIDSAIDEGIDQSSVEYAVYAKDDGVFIALATPDDDSSSVTVQELSELAAEAATFLAGTPFESVQLSATTEQGVPALTAYTDDIYLNGVVYALTAKMYVVSQGDFEGVVFMVALLPESGQVSNDFLVELPVAGADARVELGGIAYTIPEGATYLKGGALGFDFVIVDCGDPEGAFLGLGVPQVGYLPAVTLADLESLVSDEDLDLDELADDLSETLAQLGIELGQTVELTSAWTQAFDYAGFPALGAELNFDADGAAYYFGLLGVFFSGDYSFALFLTPADSTFADEVLDSMVVSEEYAALGSVSASGETEAPSQSDDPGFTVGM